ISDAVEAVVMRAMDKDRARRYQTMAEVERDLERLLAGDQNVGFVPRPTGAGVEASAAPKRWPLLTLGGGVLVATVVGLLAWPSTPQPIAEPASVAAPAVAPPTP